MAKPSKYEPLTEYLCSATEQGRTTVELSFEDIASLVGELPPSARNLRNWWANSSQSQALAWRAAGFHVGQVYLDRGRVRFERGTRGGTRHDNRAVVSRAGAAAQSSPRAPDDRAPVGPAIDVRIVLQWTAAGQVTLDSTGKPAFPALATAPGLYRLSFRAGPTQRLTVYIGETDNVRRRLSGNYRSPGPRQKTSLRINALLREHLSAGGTIELALATRCDLYLDAARSDLDLTWKAGRLLAENAALVAERLGDASDIANLG